MADDHSSTRLVWLLGLLLLVGSIAGTAWYFDLIPWPFGPGAPPTLGDPGPPLVIAQGHVDVRSRVVALYPAQPGRVVKVLVREGESVSAKGQPLLELDDRLARLRRDEAKAALDAAETQCELARKTLEQFPIKVRQQEAAIKIAQEKFRSAEAQYKRTKRLVELQQASEAEETIAESQRDGARAALEAEKARLDELRTLAESAAVSLRQAEVGVEAAKTRLEQAKLAVDECVIRSPSPGKVLRLEVAEGDMLTAQPLQPPILFCPDEPLIVRAEVPQEDAGRVHEGDEATVTDESRSDMPEWRGKVVYVSDWLARRRSILLEPGQLNDVRTLECIIQLDNGGPRLRIGQRVLVRITPRSDHP